MAQGDEHVGARHHRRRVARLLLRRRVAAGLLAVYSVALLVVVLEPFPSLANGSIGLTYRVVHALGAPGWVGPNDVEFALNIVLFVPVPLLGSFLFPRLAWEAWVGVVLLASGAIEYVQLLVLPGRSPALHDIVANTLGGVIGALLGRWARSKLVEEARGEPKRPEGIVD